MFAVFFSAVGILMYAALLITLVVIIKVYFSFKVEPDDDDFLPIRNREPGIPVRRLAQSGD